MLPGSRPRRVVLQLIAEDEVVQDVVAEGVGLRDQRVVVVVLRLIGVGQQILEIEYAVQAVAVGEVSHGQPIFVADLLIDRAVISPRL